MRKSRKVLAGGLLVLFLGMPALFALEVPKRADGYVTDRAKLLSPASESNLESYLQSFEEKTSNQVVVATFPSLEGDSLEDFSIRLAEAWKVGQKGKSNGVIFLIFKKERKMRIEVGYGLEPVLPDITAGQIISQVVAPYFKKGDYESGIFSGVDAIVKATRGEFKGTGAKHHSYPGMFFLFIFILLLNFGLRASSTGIGTRKGRFGFFYTGGSGGSFGGGGFGGGGFSGGGGSFGGGGASGGW